MVQGKFKSHHFRKISTRVPSGKSIIHYKERKPAKAHCAKCGAVLSGMTRVKATILATIPKSLKRPERPYGGYLCTKCMREEMKSRARSLEFN